jgi:PDZ domain-containing protein
MARLPTGRLFAAAAVLLAILLAAAWFVPSGYYLFVPNSARPLDGKVEVEGGVTDTGPGVIRYVDVTVREATWLERLAGFLRPEGSTLVPDEQVVPAGTSFEDRRAAAAADMRRSEEVAAAVALEQAGFDVAVSPEGALVEGVAPDVPAAGALRAGDVIVSVDGKPVRTPDRLRALLGTVAPGDEVLLGLERAGKQRDVHVETVAAPDDPGRAVIGIRVAQAADIDLPVDVDIDLGDVGGPSAGLAFALQVMEELGKNVDQGLDVAATGEIDVDGGVGPVGGIKQKTYGARRAGVDVFLVPAGDNAAEARRYARGLRVVPVKSFQQALRALATAAQNG